SNFQGDSFQMISDFYRQLRYIEVQAPTAEGGMDVLIPEAPEALGPLADTTFIPFVCGEMESLLSELGDRQVRYESSQSNGLGLILRFVPQAG
ncbi:MAG: hypothetical protein H8E48_14690, partial [Chloroflexi bacterium]|nr:hypothetical protein [Chloroflexota bacterium]